MRALCAHVARSKSVHQEHEVQAAAGQECAEDTPFARTETFSPKLEDMMNCCIECALPCKDHEPAYQGHCMLDVCAMLLCYVACAL